MWYLCIFYSDYTDILLTKFFAGVSSWSDTIIILWILMNYDNGEWNKYNYITTRKTAVYRYRSNSYSSHLLYARRLTVFERDSLFKLAPVLGRPQPGSRRSQVDTSRPGWVPSESVADVRSMRWLVKSFYRRLQYSVANGTARFISVIVRTVRAVTDLRLRRFTAHILSVFKSSLLGDRKLKNGIRPVTIPATAIPLGFLLCST